MASESEAREEEHLPDPELESLRQLSSPPVQAEGTSNSPALVLLRVLLYLSPGPLCAVCAIMAGQFINSLAATIALIAFFPLLTFGIGVFDGLLSSSVPKENGRPVLSALGIHAFTFLWLQLLLGPLTAFGFVAFLALFFHQSLLTIPPASIISAA